MSAILIGPGVTTGCRVITFFIQTASPHGWSAAAPVVSSGYSSHVHFTYFRPLPSAVCRFALVEQPETAQAPGTSGVQGGRQAPQRQNSTPISPSLPNSPPIEGGSRMPSSGSVGDFFSNLFGRSAVNRAAEQSQPASGASNATTSANRPDDRGRDTNETQPDLDLDLD